MNSRLTFSVLACVALAQAQNPDQPVINTPTSVVQCLPTLLTFSGGSPPYTISAIPAGQVGAAALADLAISQNGPSYTWKANLPANTAITLQIRDSRGVINYSQAVTIQQGTDTSCMGASQPSPTPTNPSGPVATGSASTTPPPSTNPTPGPDTNSTSTPAGTNSSAAAHPNAAVPVFGSNSITNSSVSPASNQTKGPSIFAPPINTTSTLSNSSSASTNAPNSAASTTLVQLKGVLASLAIASAALTIFA